MDVTRLSVHFALRVDADAVPPVPKSVKTFSSDYSRIIAEYRVDEATTASMG